MNRPLDQYLTYQQWLLDRGQPIPKLRRCPKCGYFRQPIPTRLVAYDSLTDRERKLLTTVMSEELREVGMAEIHCCSSNGGRLCVEQWQDWQQAQLVIFLGNPSAGLVVGEQRFAHQQGKINKLGTRINYCLTFHPRDILRYRDNDELWRRDLQNVPVVNK